MRYAILLLFLPLLAFAGGEGGDVVIKKFNNPTWDNSVNQDQLQEQGQSQSQTQSTDQSNSQVFNLSSPDDIKIRNVPGVSMGGIYPANPCHQAVQGSVAVPGFGFGAGTSLVDEVCQQLEWIRVAYQMGMREAAVWKLCSMSQAEGIPGCDPVNDYNHEIAMMEADNNAFRLQYEKQRTALSQAEKERDKYKALLEEERMRWALEK